MARPSVEAERREQILTATCEVLSDQGRHALRLSDVARRAGVSSGIIHYYFASKADVLAAAFEFNFTRSLERRRSLLDTDEDPLDLLRHVVESYLPSKTTQTAWHVWAELWAEAMRDTQLREINESLYGEWRSQVTELVSRAQDAGSLRPGDPVVYANMLIAMVDGLATQVLVGSSEMSPVRMHAVVGEFFDSYLTDRRAP